jgi:hypothetical protein
MTADSYLRCTVCGRESSTNFASSLRHGWERCCGYTMTLVRTTVDIETATTEVLAEQTEPLRKALG